MIQFLSVVRILARRSLSARLVVPLAVVGCWNYLYMPDPSWAGRWLETSLNLHTFLAIIAGPSIGAASCWDLMRARHRGDLLLSSSRRSFLADASARLVAGIAWSVVVLVLVTAAAMLRNVLAGQQGIPDLAVVGLGLGLVAVEIAGALTVASFVPGIAAVAVFLVICYGGLFLHVQEEMPVGPRRFFPLIEEHWDPSAAPLYGRLVLATVWCLAFSVALLGLVGAIRGRPAGLRATAGVGAAVLCAAVVVFTFTPTTADSYFSAPRTVRDMVCSDGAGGRVCVWAPDAFQLPVLRAGFSVAARAAAGAVEMPTLLREQGLPSGSTPNSAEFFFTSAPSSPEVVAAKVLEELVPLPAESCGRLLNVDALGGFPLHFAVRDVLLRRAGVPVREPDSALANAVSHTVAAPRTEQDRWLVASISALRTCDAPPPLPSTS